MSYNNAYIKELNNFKFFLNECAYRITVTLAFSLLWPSFHVFISVENRTARSKCIKY